MINLIHKWISSRNNNTGNKINFLIASPRSGTTWLNKALGIHPNIYTTENRLFGEYADFVFDEGKNHPRLRLTLDKYIQSGLIRDNIKYSEKLETKLTQQLLKTIFDFQLTHSQKQILIDKITPYEGTSEIVINKISKYFPKSKIIYLLRDGRDVVTSGVFHWFNKVLHIDNLALLKRERNAIFLGKKEGNLKRFFMDAELKEWCNTWSGPVNTITKAKKNHQVLIIRYEEMLQNQSLVLSNIFNFLDTKNSKKILKDCVSESSFKKMSNNRMQGQEIATAHIRKGISGDWKNYFTKKDGQLFVKYTEDMLINHSYENNNDWINNLPTTL